jgi:endo-1,4-beta-xylanase
MSIDCCRSRSRLASLRALGPTHPARILIATTIGIVAIGCSKSAGLGTGSGGVPSEGGATASGGSDQGGAGSVPIGAGGYLGTGGSPGSGGDVATGGMVETAGRLGAGGIRATGGAMSQDGGSRDLPAGTGGATSGGASGTGGAGVGDTMGAGGAGGGNSGTVVKGGSSGTGGVATGGSSTSTSPVAIDCNATLPSTGVQHSGNTQGTLGDLAWSLWSNGGGVTMTTFDRPAFRAAWGPNSGDVLARFGVDFGNGGLTYDHYGPITAQFFEIKSGTGGGYSYIGVYGFSADPCVEFYIVEDSYVAMPVKPYSTTHKGTVAIDGASYDLYSGSVTAADVSSCRGAPWRLFYSVRQTARTCGQISITQHFDAWKAAGMVLGDLTQVAVLAEVGGGTGSIDFPLANVMLGQ